jgi:hypothetical protein
MAHDITKALLERIKPYQVEYLYKYRSLNSRGLEDIFSKNEVYLSDPTAFNDPFDCKPLLVTYTNDFKIKQFYQSLVRHRFPNATKDQIKRELKNNPQFRKIRTQEYLENELFPNFIKGFGVYCLSEVPDDILMWSHYSDSHKGICLQFMATIELTIFWESYKVTYQEKYPEVNVMNLGDYPQFFNFFATKSNHWEYEKEWRIIKTPHEGGAGIYTFQPELLTGVIIGAKISPGDEKAINDWVSKRKTPIRIFKAQMNRKSYRLDIEGINC